MKVGRYQVDLVSDGAFALDGGAMFGVVPRPLWSRSNPPDETNRIDMGLTCMVCRFEDRVLLVDAGIGHKFEPRFQDIYRIDHSENDIERSLAGVGLAAGQITDVVMTHLHFDHAGGLTKAVSGGLEPTFPRARHYVQKRHLEWALAPSAKDAGSFIEDDFRPLLEKGLLETLDGPGELFPGLWVHPLDGHSPAMQAVLLEGDPPLFFAADLLPTTTHLHLPYIMAYDVQPLITVKEKEQYLSRAVEEGWTVVFEHDPRVGLGTVERFKGRYRLGSVIEGHTDPGQA